MAEEFEAGTPEHLPFDHFRLVVDAFRSPVVVRECDSGGGCLEVEVEAAGEGVQVRKVGGACVGDPLQELTGSLSSPSPPYSPRTRSRHQMAGKRSRAPGKGGRGMRRGQNHKAEAWAVLRVNTVIVEDLKWHSGNNPLPDFGVDVLTEIVAADDLVTPETVTEQEARFSVVVPRAQRFDGSALEPLLALARRRGGVLESLRDHYAVLPAAAVRPLGRVEGTDRLAAARLAERLASGRDHPGLAISSLVAAQPTWITRSAAAQELWLAAGAYAEQHSHLGVAGSAFAQAE